MRTVLLNPGPVNLSGRVRAALAQPDICHREPEFARLQHAVRRGLLAVYGLDDAVWGSVLLTGSGTAAVEAMISSCVPRGGRLLSIENGVYGERMSLIAEANGIELDRLTTDWLAAPDADALDAALGEKSYTHVSVVHHETTTGRLNRIALLAEVCKRHGVSLLLDAVSSFGAEEIDFGDWPIAACAGTANKCLHGAPGVAFVIVRRSGLAESAKRSVYLDLATYLNHQDAGSTPFTQSIQTLYALEAALDEFFDAGGWRARNALFAERMGAIHAALSEIGVESLLPESERSCVLEAFNLQGRLAYSKLHDALKARGFVIYAGRGKLAAEAFRISAMGDITTADLERLGEELRKILAKAGAR